jgi:hypothetical protein
VAKKQSLSLLIIHEERAFICDRCAGARVRFSPLVVLLLWVPVLALITTIIGFGVVRSVARIMLTGIGTMAFPVSVFWRLLLLLGLLFLIGVLVRLAWRQMHAVREGLFHYLPYSSSVARVAIELRKKDLLRSLHLSTSNALFLTEDHAIIAHRRRGRIR